jgi:hypothetical protein
MSLGFFFIIFLESSGMDKVQKSDT